MTTRKTRRHRLTCPHCGEDLTFAYRMRGRRVLLALLAAAALGAGVAVVIGRVTR